MNISILEFLNRVQARLGSGPGALPDVPGLTDPLQSIVQIIRSEPATLRARTLAKVVQAVYADSAILTENDVYKLDQQALALVVALSNDYLEGRYTADEWTHAISQIVRSIRLEGGSIAS